MKGQFIHAGGAVGDVLRLEQIEAFSAGRPALRVGASTCPLRESIEVFRAAGAEHD
jgi:hypothetical protein